MKCSHRFYDHDKVSVFCACVYVGAGLPQLVVWGQSPEVSAELSL